MKNQLKFAVAVLIVSTMISVGGFTYWSWVRVFPVAVAPVTGLVTALLSDQTPEPLPEAVSDSVGFGGSVTYEAPTTTINSAIAKDFDIKTIKNLNDMEKAYGFTFSSAELNALTKNKFVVKNLLDTSIRPLSNDDNVREFTQLYAQVQGQGTYRDRGPQNAMFYSSDVFFNAYNNLYVELLKEMENKTFYPNILTLSQIFYQEAEKKLAAATTDVDKKKWMKVRNYFAVPYAILTTAAQPLTSESYNSPNGEMLDPAKVQADYITNDAKVDTYVAVAAFVKTLKLDSVSEKAVLESLNQVYAAGGIGAPIVFAKEYEDYAGQEGIDFKVDFTQFTPRGTYTSSSLRRQYFRGMKWYIMLPFFLKSQDLTAYSFAISQLMSENPTQLKDYSRLESAIGFMVGTSDDLMPVDYLQALQSSKGTSDETLAAMSYLVKAKNPLIMDLAGAGEDALLKAKGMRFFSGKFIIDSYWTGMLTQGDGALKPGYTQKLPPMASSLEVMTLLGSDYAKTQIPKLDFYTPKYSKAIDQALTELKAQNDLLTDLDWKKNLYMGWLWTIKGLFSFLQTNHDSLPRFMQSMAWEAKTLQTASAFWTELRHATILYAKQSFAAEMGGGGENCDPRVVPPPPKGYIEPQLEAFARLSYLAKRTNQGLKDQGFNLKNMYPLESFVGVMDTVQSYVRKELGNELLSEHVTKETIPDPNTPGKTCTRFYVDPGSDWEDLRVELLSGMKRTLPSPVEGPIILAKDRRAAIVADVHTGGDSANPIRILYEGEGVPYVIFTAVSDANGPRLTVGFISSQYEFTKAYGGKRMTDEDWQMNFFKDSSNPYNAYNYTNKKTWPEINTWYKPMFEAK